MFINIGIIPLLIEKGLDRQFLKCVFEESLEKGHLLKCIYFRINTQPPVIFFL